MMIVGVVRNPGDEEEEVMSMQEAVEADILDLAQGLYYNSRTRERISMVEAMNSGWIKVLNLTSQLVFNQLSLCSFASLCLVILIGLACSDGMSYC